MIYTSYFAKLKELEKHNIIPISICGKAPDWYKGLQYKKLAPKYRFFMEWKKNHDNDYYTKCFNEQVLNTINPFWMIIHDFCELIPYWSKKDLQLSHSTLWESKDVNIALICYEKPSDFCHRHLVAEWLNQNGFKCNEWRKP